jgi:hypothetical protein
MAVKTWRDGLGKRDLDLADMAIEAFGLKPDEVMDVAVRGGVVTVVTIGGHKARWKTGDEVKPLHDLYAGRSIKPVAPPKPE